MRLVETEPGLDADHEQVQCVGQPETDAMLPAFRHARQDHARQDVANRADRERHQQAGLSDDRRREERERRQRDADADAEEDDDRLGVAEAGNDQPLLQLAHFL